MPDGAGLAHAILPQESIALTWWNRLEPRPRAPEIAEAVAARVRDPLWMLTRQWQLGEFQGEDAASPAWVQLEARTSPFVGWRPAGSGPFQPIDAPLEDLVETEAFTPDLATQVELGHLLERRLAAQGLAGSTLAAIVAAFRRDYPLRTAAVPASDRAGKRFAALCAGRAVDGVAAAAPGAPLPADPAVAAEAARVTAALAEVTAEVRAIFGEIGTTDPPAWRRERLEYDVEVLAHLADGREATLRADPDRDATFEWFAFDVATDPRPASGAPSVAAVSESRFPTHVRFRGMPNHRWWDFERAGSDFAAITADRRDLAKLLLMDFMLLHGNDFFMLPFDLPVGSSCRIDQLLVHDVFGGITALERADRGPRPGAPAWSCFSIARSGEDGRFADFFLLPPSAGAARQQGEALEDVRLLRDEQANLAWAIEHAAEGADGRRWLGHERYVAEKATEAAAPEPASAAPLAYRLQTFVPWHWYPLVPVSLDPLTGETALEKGEMVRPDGRVPAPVGRLLSGPAPYRIREEVVTRAGMRALREPVRSRWLLGTTHLWLARRRLAGRGEGSSGLRYDLAKRT